MGVGEGVEVGGGLPVAVGVGDGVAVGVGVAGGSGTSRQAENSEVLPFGSVAAAVRWSPGEIFQEEVFMLKKAIPSVPVV